MQSLLKLEAAFDENPKLSHNKAVAEFYKSEFKKYDEFKQNLDEIIGDSAIGNLIGVNDMSLLVPLFNKAILLFQSRQPIASLKIILVLVKHLDVIDTTIAQKIGLLAINLLLNLNQPKKAEAIVDLLYNRLNNCSELFAASEEDDTVLLLDKSFDLTKSIKSLEQFRWMFRLYKLRSSVLNEKSVLIPNEEVKLLMFRKEMKLLIVYILIGYFRHRKCWF